MSTTVIKNGNVNIQIPRHLYSSLISPENFSSDMCIGPSTINKIIVSADNTSNITKAASITYSAILTPQLLYSNKIEVTGNAHLTFTNVKVKTNKEVVASAVRIGDQATGTYKTPDKVFLFDSEDKVMAAIKEKTAADLAAKGGVEIKLINKGTSAVLSSKTSGLSPNPFQAPELCLAPSFWNCMYSSTLSLSTNGAGTGLSDTTPRYHDLICRTLPEEETKLVYDCALYPDKNIIRNERLLAMTKTMAPIVLRHYDGGYGHARVLGTVDKSPNGVEETDPNKHVVRGNAFTFDERLPTYNDINRDVTNSNSKLYRGQYEKNAEYVFEKAKASPNYKIEKEKAIIGSDLVPFFKITKLDSDTKLNTAYVNGFCFPTHFTDLSGMTDEEAYHALGDLFFFKYDNISPFCVKGDPPARVPEPADTDKSTTYPAINYCYLYKNEPEGQYLKITKTIKGYTHTLFNPLLTMSDTNMCCYSNTSLFKCTFNRTSASIVDCLSYIGGIRLSDRERGDNIVNVDFSVSDLSLVFDQYSMNSMESSIKSVSTLFYNNWSMVREQSASVKKSEAKNGYITKEIKLNNISIGADMPKSICFLLDGGSHGEPLYGCRIKRLSSSLSSGQSNDSTKDRNKHQLYLDTKNSMLSNYTLQDLNSNYQVPFEYHTKHVHGVGSLIVISLDNMGLSSQTLVSGVSSKTFTIGYTLDVEIPAYHRVDDTPYNVRALCYHISECFMTLENSQSSMYNQLYTTDDVINSIKMVKDASDNNKLTQSSRRYTAGSFTSILKGLYTLPKIISTASNVANTVASVANTASNALNTADNFAKKATSVFRPR